MNLTDFKKLNDKRIVGITLTIIYIFSFIGYLILLLIGINFISIFQSGLLIIFGLLTGIFLNLTFGFEYKTYDKDKVRKTTIYINRILKHKITIITISLISIVFLAIYAYNLTNILAFGCPSIGGPLRDIELLNYDEIGYYIEEVPEEKDDHHHHNNNKEKRDLNFIPNSKVHNFVLYRLCNDENVLFFIILFSLFFLVFLHLFTIVSYVKDTTIQYWIQENQSKYNHFVFLLLHFMPLCIILFFQIVLVYKVSVIESGLLIPFGLLTGTLVSVIFNSNKPHFIITRINRIIIILSSFLSLIFVGLFIINISILYSQCSGPINFPSTPITNKMFSDFMIIELCQNEFVYTIFILIYIYYLIGLNIITLSLFIFYFKINSEKSYF